MASDIFSEHVEDCDQLELYNETELRQICRGIGLDVPSTTEKKTLIHLLEKEVKVPPRNPINDLRDDLMRLILEHWEVLNGQLNCPAKSRDPRACYQCLDARVLHCLTMNPAVEPGIAAMKEQTK